MEKFCMDCRWWGQEWLKDLSKHCFNPQNQKVGHIYATGMMATCEQWEAKPPDYEVEHAITNRDVL